MRPEFCFFETDWGFVGLVGNNHRVSSLILPLPEPTLVIQSINRAWGGKQIENPRLLTRLQEQVKAYFAGHRIEQWDCEPDLDGCSLFYPPGTAGCGSYSLRNRADLRYARPPSRMLSRGQGGGAGIKKKSPAVNNPLPPGGSRRWAWWLHGTGGTAYQEGPPQVGGFP